MARCGTPYRRRAFLLVQLLPHSHTWLKTLSHLCFGNFIRASIWFTLGCGVLFWWMGTDIDTLIRGCMALP